MIAGPGEEIQHAVLARLHRIAIASGHAVLAVVRDERIGYAVRLQVEPDGSSRFTAEPDRLSPDRDRERDRDRDRDRDRGPADAGDTAEPARVPDADRPTHLLRSVPEPQAASGQASGQALGHASGHAPGQVAPGQAPDRTPGPAAVQDATPTFRLRPASAAQASGDAVPTFALRSVPEPVEGTSPGTVAPPTGEFGPPPPMDAGSRHPAEPSSGPGLPASPALTPRSSSGSMSRPLTSGATPEPDLGFDPDPRPTPPRGFDAVAEAVLGDEPFTTSGSNHLADPMARVNEAVRSGRIDTAASLAEQTVAQASATLGPEHPEVLRLRELTAYIAYLAGEPLRAFRLSLDLALICRRAADPEAAYGNVRSAATAWRGVRDPLLGLELGHELIALWSELAAGGGAAADEIEELESARARMGRLTGRARARQS
ncbi:tetratricopeptide repeat protein [Streptomyces sp. CHD11]|nr:tetratricopeptide repeat protein [Streptomyces sp. CHD11]